MSLLPRLSLLLAAAMGLAIPAHAEKPKFAVVNISEAFEAYHLTILEKEKIREACEALKRDPRREKIKLMKVALMELRDEVRDITLTEAEQQARYREFHMTYQDLRVLEREASKDLDEQARDIDTAMVEKTRHLLDEVRAAVEKIAKEGGYDFVFETGGKTNSRIPALIYIRNATDITSLVTAALNSTKPDEKDIATLPNSGKR